MIPVASGPTLPTTPISANANNPRAMPPLYRRRYGKSPRRFFHAETFGGSLAAALVPKAALVVAAALIAAGDSHFAGAPLPSGNAHSWRPETDNGWWPDSSALLSAARAYLHLLLMA